MLFIQNMGTMEWLIILLVITIIFRRSTIRDLGRTIGNFQHSQKGAPPPQKPGMAGNTLDECYRALDLAPGASVEQIRGAYKELVKVWHPDRFGQDEKLRERATRKLQQINAAYEKLCRAHDTHSQN